MNTPKLPPLPDLLEKAISQFAKAVYYADTDERIGAANNLRKEIKAYALAAIEAQGVPDIDALTDAIAEGLKGTYHCTRVWEAWRVGTMGQDDFEPVDESDTPREIAETVIAMLASAPPAPQADNWRQYATEREDTAQAVIERHRKEHESLLRLLTKDRQTIADLKASVVQQEPVAWAKDTGKKLRITNMSMVNDDGWRPLVYGDTHPAQQAKPQPLCDERKIAMWTQATIENCSHMACYMRGIEDAEASHGIKE